MDFNSPGTAGILLAILFGLVLIDKFILRPYLKRKKMKERSEK